MCFVSITKGMFKVVPSDNVSFYNCYHPFKTSITSLKLVLSDLGTLKMILSQSSGDFLDIRSVSYLRGWLD